MNIATTRTAQVKALQQPAWANASQVGQVRDRLASLPPLVTVEQVELLRGLLAQVGAGRALVLQCGDCVEDPADCGPGPVTRKAELLRLLAGMMAAGSGKPVLRVGRIAGQFAKPRSRSTERVGDTELPVFRGHLVNSPEPTSAGRRPDPLRLLAGYRLASQVMSYLGWRQPDREPGSEAMIWTSHEALVLDYELPMVRADRAGRPVLTSTHWPWIGERTRQPAGAHVEMLAQVVNPVACKVGPEAVVGEVLQLCDRLDPRRQPGRLTLIARMGAHAVVDLLPALVGAARAAGHPVIWLCDPMHGNTVVGPGGIKTRFLESIEQEVRGFRWAVEASGGIVGGLHLETTPHQVAECRSRESGPDRRGAGYISLCDPRLNPEQAVRVVGAWLDAGYTSRHGPPDRSLTGELTNVPEPEA